MWDPVRRIHFLPPPPACWDTPISSVLSGEISKIRKQLNGVEMALASPPTEETCVTDEVGSEKKTRGPSVTTLEYHPHGFRPFCLWSCVKSLYASTRGGGTGLSQ